MGMFDFRDVQASSKAEQIRAYSVEQAIEVLSGSAPTDDMVIKTAEAIEQFIVHGKSIESTFRDG